MRITTNVVVYKLTYDMSHSLCHTLDFHIEFSYFFYLLHNDASPIKHDKQHKHYIGLSVLSLTTTTCKYSPLRDINFLITLLQITMVLYVAR